MKLSQSALQQLTREEPRLIQGAFDGDPSMLWRAFVGVCHARRRGDHKARIRLYVEQRLASGYHFAEIFDPTPFLPNSSHHSFQEYARALRGSLQGQRFGLVINNLHTFDFALWKSAQRLLEGVYTHLGRPTGGASLDLFFGDYHRTPFGIHKDDQDVFTWVVEGDKRFHLWPFERLSSRPELASSQDGLRREGAKISANEEEYQQLLAESIVLDAKPGDMMYWPASYWHCADNPNGALALTIGPGVVFDGDLLRDQVQRAWSEITPSQEKPFTGDGRLSSRDLQRSLRAVSSADSIRDMQRAFAKASLATYTGSSFFSVPEAAEAEGLSDEEVLSADPSSPICWSALNAEEWVISANGHATCLSAPRALLQKLERMLQLVIKEPTSTRDLLACLRKQSRGSQSAARSLLSLLVSWRALRVSSPPG